MPHITGDRARIPSNYSRLIARVLGLKRYELSALLTRTGISLDQLMQDDALLTARQQIQILQNALRLSDDEMLGLRLGQYLTPATHGALGFMASSSANLLVALQAFEAYIPTRIDFFHLELKHSKKYLECYGSFDIALDDDVHRALEEILASVFLQCAEFIIGHAPEDACIYFSFDAPGYSQRYSEFLSGSIEFSAPQLTLKLPAELCHIPNASANHASYSLALQQCQSMLAQLADRPYGYTLRIQKMMLSQSPGVLSEEEAAAMLFMSKRTLARKLKLEGANFRTIRDEMLSQQASCYLQNSGMPVDAVAAVLNYHDSSNFRRAFKRWFGMTPDQYRKHSLSLRCGFAGQG